MQGIINFKLLEFANNMHELYIYMVAREVGFGCLYQLEEELDDHGGVDAS